MSRRTLRVSLDSVAHDYRGQHRLFSNLTAELLPDHVYALVGPSGSGKSTLLSLLAGWYPPLSGTIAFEGVDRVGWVFQNPHGVAQRSALDHVSLPLQAGGARRPAAKLRALTLLREFGLADVASHRFSELSGGEAQRLMLARGIAAAPQLLLVDEPTAQLDMRTAERVNESLQALAHRGAIVVVATHDQNTRRRCTDVLDLADYA